MKNNKKLKSTIRFLIGITLGIIVSAVGVYAATIIGKGSNLTYDNTSSNLSSTNIQDALDELKSSLNCPEGKICVKTPLKLGDYISMTPTKSSYTIDIAKTGYTGSQTINPQELNLWRVISINPDGTVDMISEYSSNDSINFSGVLGYANYVGYLNLLSSQYENSTYTKRARVFGYDKQTEYITDTSKITSDVAPFKCKVDATSRDLECSDANESQGSGDDLYKKDYNLLKKALGSVETLTANKRNSGDYCVGSRSFYPNDIQDGTEFTSDYYYWGYYGNMIATGSRIEMLSIYSNDQEVIYYPEFFCHLRPILTLKSGLKYTGSGTEKDPYTLSK